MHKVIVLLSGSKYILLVYVRRFIYNIFESAISEERSEE